MKLRNLIIRSLGGYTCSDMLDAIQTPIAKLMRDLSEKEENILMLKQHCICLEAELVKASEAFEREGIKPSFGCVVHTNEAGIETKAKIN
jgi:hypothetical protein